MQPDGLCSPTATGTLVGIDLSDPRTTDDPGHARSTSAVATGGQWWLTWHQGDPRPRVRARAPRAARACRSRKAMTIGRGEEATVRLDDPTVSRRHARIVLGPDGPVIEDAGSRFGVFVDGQTLAAPHLLLPGAEIRLGNVALHVERVVPETS